MNDAFVVSLPSMELLLCIGRLVAVTGPRVPFAKEFFATSKSPYGNTKVITAFEGSRPDALNYHYLSPDYRRPQKQNTYIQSLTQFHRYQAAGIAGGGP